MDNFSNLMGSKIHLLQNFHEDRINSFYVRLLTDRQTDRQTNERRIKQNLLGGDNKVQNFQINRDAFQANAEQCGVFSEKVWSTTAFAFISHQLIDHST